MSKIVKITALAPGAVHAIEFQSSALDGALKIQHILEPVAGHQIDDLATGDAIGFIPTGWAMAIRNEQ